ncbi:hypothetical protein B0A58_16050, partial [Flavobacterium branchiophilum NBRC 15030 = ATCC 35035]
MRGILKYFSTIKNIFTFLFLLFSFALNAQARLTIENNSMRTMTVKVMQGTDNNASLHEIVTIQANSSETINFSESGHYFTKTKAVISGKEAIYLKGQPFMVTNDDTGYSILTQLA